MKNLKLTNKLLLIILPLTFIFMLGNNLFLISYMDGQENTNAFKSKKTGKERSSNRIAEDEKWNAYVIVGISCLIAVFFSGLVVCLLIRHFINTPIQKLIKIIREMASGELRMEADLNRDDEIGQIGVEVNKLIHNFIDIIRQADLMSYSISESSKNILSSTEKTTNTVGAMNNSIKMEKEVYQSLRATIHKTSELITETLTSIESVAENINNQAAVVEQSSTAIEEMTQSISSVNDTSQAANQITQNLLVVSKEGEDSVQRVVEANQDIVNFSKQISEMVGLISNIAEQTNLLAMNAAIEAAHAGEYGKGFAVVADEIRKLAENSGKSASDITAIIKEVIEKIENSSVLGGQALEGLHRILDDVNETTRINAEISSATEEQAKGANDILKSVTSLRGVTDKVKQATQSQRKGNKAIFDYLKAIQEESSVISTAIEAQAEESQSIIEATHLISEAVEENIVISETLQGLISFFKYRKDQPGDE